MAAQWVPDLLLNLITELIGIGITYILIERLLEETRNKQIQPLREIIYWDIAWHYDEIKYYAFNISLTEHNNNEIIVLLKRMMQQISYIDEIVERNLDIMDIKTRSALERLNPSLKLIIDECMPYGGDGINTHEFIKESMELILHYTNDLIQDNFNVFKYRTEHKTSEEYIRKQDEFNRFLISVPNNYEAFTKWFKKQAKNKTEEGTNEEK
ncbi:MAG: hypothetical protein ACTSW1_09620 [Candidatus Hodarchaeales archaeon]